jgi:transposase/transposase-like protein
VPKRSGKLVLNSDENEQLRQLIRAQSTPQGLAQRARVIELAAQGLSVRAIGQQIGMHHNQVVKWRRRFIKGGVGALQDQPRSGRKGRIEPKVLRQILDQATRPPHGRGRWSCRTLANALGISKATVQRVWSENEIKPHLTRVFKLSTDPDFETKFWDVIGLYLNPPEQAVVLCCDEKSQIQALQRSQPGLPLGKGHIRTQTHDYYRNGTVTLFAALDYLQGKVIAHTAQKHTHRQWLEFLKRIDREIPLSQHIHIILDNYATHKHPAVKRWLARHPRFELHFTPTGSSWMNLVERFFRDLSQQAILPGSFGSVPQLVEAIMQYLVQHNLNPKRYVWRAKGEDLLAKIQRAWSAALREDSNVTLI